MKRNILLGLLACLSVYCVPAMAQNSAKDVLEKARLVNAYFMQKYSDPTRPTYVKKERPSSLWTRGVYYEGLMALQQVSPKAEYIDYIDRWGEFHKWTPRNGEKTTDADDQCCGQTYLDRYVQKGRKDTAMLNPILRNLNNQMNTQRVDYWTWIDAIQMAMPLYAQAYKITGNRKYLDYAMKCYRWTRDKCAGGLFNKFDGLWWRDKDFVPPYKEKDGKNCYWSRGNGWVYLALMRVMDTIGTEDPYYKELEKDFRLMSGTLKRCVREDGMWNVSLVSPFTYGGPEVTGTSLFLCGMSWGIRKGVLSRATFKPLCDTAWKRMANKAIHPNGFLGYVQGTGKEPKDGQPVTFTQIPDFEDFGIGCFLLGAVEYSKLLK